MRTRSTRSEKQPLVCWEVLKSDVAFDAPPWVRVSVDKVRLPDGRVVDRYHQVGLADFVVIVAQTPDQRVIVERQYKHGVGRVTLALPAGVLDAGEDSLTCARRELREETGYESADWCSLGPFVANGTYGCGIAHLFLARDAARVAEPDGRDLEETEILLLTPQEIAEAIRDGRLAVLSSLAAFAMATHPLFQPPPR